MHGRLKVKSTEEQLEAKRKEREKKLLLYTTATSKIFTKKQNQELDEELLLLTAQVLAANPDFYTLWNYRKETFLDFQNTKTQEELQSVFQSELLFLESCLKVNHKSYGCWHHRCFVMNTMPQPDWKRELELCNQFLKYDERNFHCWDYRRFVVRKANISPQSELEFTLSKINNNFSNYSSWHYRSKLLPIVFPDATQPMGVSEEALLKEYELVQNGFFTDPDDQSNWFYHRWLMGRGEQVQEVNFFSVSRQESRAVITFTKHVKIGKDTDVIIHVNGSKVDGLTWVNPDRDDFYSTMWITNDLHLPDNAECKIDVSLLHNKTQVCCSSLLLGPDENGQSSAPVKPNGPSYFSQELSAVKSDTLQLELESVLQLMELETDNKWVVLTVVLLMKALDPSKHQEEILRHLDRLEALDFKRANYYRDLRSKFIIENIIDVAAGSRMSVLNLSKRGITKLYHTELLPSVEVADLSFNLLRDLQHLNYLQNLRELNLSSCGITNCLGLQHLPRLESLDLSNNGLSSPEIFKPLQLCPRLKHVCVTGNPICESERLIEGLQELLDEVEIQLKVPV